MGTINPFLSELSQIRKLCHVLPLFRERPLHITNSAAQMANLADTVRIAKSFDRDCRCVTVEGKPVTMLLDTRGNYTLVQGT